MIVDWERYQKCPVCGAGIGVAYFSLSGARSARRDRPHATRKLRAAAARGER